MKLATPSKPSAEEEAALEVGYLLWLSTFGTSGLSPASPPATVTAENRSSFTAAQSPLIEIAPDSGFYPSGASNEGMERALGVTPEELPEDVLERTLGELSQPQRSVFLLVRVAQSAPEGLEYSVEFRA